MAAAFKVKLDDGVEVGPLDGRMLLSWYQQGMIHAKSKVRPTGGKQWMPLGDAVDIRAWGPPGGSHPRTDGDEEDLEPAGPQAWRTWLVSALFFLGAAGGFYFAFFPDRWQPALAGTPWREIALAQVALGLMLVRRWEPMRKTVRVLVCLLTFSVFPLAGVVLFHGVHAPSIAILAAAWVMGSALFFLLAGRALRWQSIALCLFWIAAGAATVGYFGLVPPGTPPVAAARPG